MEKVTTALIGCGQRGPRGHGIAAKKSEKLELLAVCDIDEVRARTSSELLEVEYVTDYHELLARDDLESVMIATSAKSHGPIALDAVQAGKHILVEKPLVDSVAMAKELIAVTSPMKILMTPVRILKTIRLNLSKWMVLN